MHILVVRNYCFSGLYNFCVLPYLKAKILSCSFSISVSQLREIHIHSFNSLKDAVAGKY